LFGPAYMSALVVFYGACRLSQASLRGRVAKRTLNYIGNLRDSSKGAVKRAVRRSACGSVRATDEKKPERFWLGLNPPKEEVEETKTSIGTSMLQSKKICIMKSYFII
jgi:hypothetical protein